MLNEPNSHTRAPEPPSTGAEAPDAKTAEIRAWLGQFSRTLKTCRLYDAANPNTVRFRADLAAQLTRLLESHGAFSLGFSANEVRCDGKLVLSGHSREDNFTTVFHRDGLRTLKFNPGIEPDELNVLVDLILKVTSRAATEAEDLVTLLWDADLPDLDISYVSSETKLNLSEDTSAFTSDEPLGPDAVLLPWPGEAFVADELAGDSGPSSAGASTGGEGDPGATGTGGGGGNATEAAAGATGGASPGAAKAGAAGITPRSEDWIAGEPVGELEECFLALDATSAADVDGFMSAMAHERSSQLTTSMMALACDVLRSNLLEGDRQDLAGFLERLLLEAITAADFVEARDTVDRLIECSEGQWDALSVGEVLALPDSPATAALVRHLDSSPLAESQHFVEFARSLGPATIEWLMSIVAVAQAQRTRHLLVRTLGELCEGNPERLAPWLTDPRWYVVRNAVVVVGSAEGGAPVGMFRPLLRHPEARVRQEVVAALAKCDVDAARPLLLELVRDSEASIRSAALRPLGSRRNEQASAALLKIAAEPGFRKLPIDEIRPVLAALGGCGGDEALPGLEELLHSPGWFDKGAGPFVQAVARCVAKIGTPAAFELLEAGARSRVPSTRDACRLVLKASRND